MPDISATHPEPPTGFDIIADTLSKTGFWDRLKPLTDVVVNNLTCTGMKTGSLNGATLKQGIEYNFPTITQIQLTSGSIQAFRRAGG